MSVFDVLQERGLIAQMTDESEIRKLLENEKVPFYIGFDATADSLHVGHFLQLMVMSHMQKAGHRPIVLLGTGTTMVGDPTGKTDMRKMLTVDEINHNAECFRRQMSRFIDFGEDKAILVRNGDWLMKLNYIEFLREIGVHFSVNKMLTYECFKSRLERGLTFIEFNYMLMQSYDFLRLSRDYGCKMELGGDDQWANILGGVDLVRKCDGKDVYGMTFTLLTTKEGKKMGKTEKGALWLDPEKTPPYEFFQYWRNVADADVINCLKLITFVSMDEIREMAKWEGSDLNKAKERLAYELTKLVHGEEEAEKALSAAKALFSAGGSDENMPTTQLTAESFKNGELEVLELLVLTGLAPSKGEGRRLIQQGGITVNGNKVEDISAKVTAADFTDNTLMLKKGKKVFHKVIL
ncbi:tyrosine--tRNA ligase [Acetanaerobacterium elongatum]|uniref:Tyrosine--tRNA ligase n=1 Tax=Acetanaerobacterium elongatum TaxID=258515 RepID=A0A1H0BF03_9FIRM|nr:tyrosine--tRNA ligase [Acetanaerobacterium elongatum]SDN44175.1 tyrosyl-tRNA synthetase [Acetanaerobacterium elongatum]